MIKINFGLFHHIKHSKKILFLQTLIIFKVKKNVKNIKFLKKFG